MLIKSSDLKVDESSLTGEAVPVNKNCEEKPFMLSGCAVVEGDARYLVTAVGKNSEWGKIMSELDTERPDTPLQVRAAPHRAAASSEIEPFPRRGRRRGPAWHSRLGVRAGPEQPNLPDSDDGRDRSGVRASGHRESAPSHWPARSGGAPAPDETNGPSSFQQARARQKTRPVTRTRAGNGPETQPSRVVGAVIRPGLDRALAIVADRIGRRRPSILTDRGPQSPEGPEASPSPSQAPALRAGEAGDCGGEHRQAGPRGGCHLLRGADHHMARHHEQAGDGMIH